MLTGPLFYFATPNDKDAMFIALKEQVQSMGYTIIEIDKSRPWGGYFRLQNKDAARFKEQFFPTLEIPQALAGLHISPKFLIFAPAKRLSWQVHKRRIEAWSVVNPPVGMYLSQTDEKPETPKLFYLNEIIYIPPQTRHQGGGTPEHPDTWTAVAEIWLHTDPSHPSDEADIRRIQDDFGRV